MASKSLSWLAARFNFMYSALSSYLNVEEISQQDIAQTLKPIWDEKAETAKKGDQSAEYCFHLCGRGWFTMLI